MKPSKDSRIWESGSLERCKPLIGLAFHWNWIINNPESIKDRARILEVERVEKLCDTLMTGVSGGAGFSLIPLASPSSRMMVNVGTDSAEYFLNKLLALQAHVVWGIGWPVERAER
jgi:hypothetical protein